MPSDHPSLTVANAADWSAWLTESADSSNGVMLTLLKAGHTGPTSLTYVEARDEALCHGWIDSTGYGRDDSTRVQRFTPRRSRSVWSKHNIAHVARLDKEGRMRPRGWDEVNKAKADGRWEAAYCQATTEAPADLSAAITAVPAAQAQWDILTKQNKFAMCFRLSSLKNPATRVKRVGEYVDMLARGETLHPQKRALEHSKVVKSRVKAKKVVIVPVEKKKKTDPEQVRGYRRSARIRKPVDAS